jgi:hypothetical protein
MQTCPEAAAEGRDAKVQSQQGLDVDVGTE